MDKVFVVFAALLFAVAVSFVLSWPVMALWNGSLVGAIDGIKEITWMQAWGISILCGILFKSEVSSKKDD
jgi:capsid protein